MLPSKRAFLDEALDAEMLRCEYVKVSRVTDPHLARHVVEQIMSNLEHRPMADLRKQDLRSFALEAVRTQAKIRRRGRARFLPFGAEIGVPTPIDIRLNNTEEALELLAMVPYRCRQALILCWLYGYRADEVAQQLQVSPGEVRQRVAAAFAFLVRYAMRRRCRRLWNRWRGVLNHQGKSR
jgi:DNA-directed RNA polymerase specialized sigma24 family protein